MKSQLTIIMTICCFLLLTTSAFSQSLSVESLLDKAVSLSAKGDHAATADALTQSANALETEVETSDGSLKGKLLSKVGDLKSMIPLASGGKLQSGIVGKAVKAIKMLIGANRISSLLGKGDSGLLGKASSVTNSLGLIKAGSSILGSDSQSQLNALLGEATKTSGELDKKGLTGKLAATASSKSLDGIVKLVSSAL